MPGGELPPGSIFHRLIGVGPDWLDSLTIGTASGGEIPIQKRADIFINPTADNTVRTEWGSTMTGIPHSWEAYARLQRRLANTTRVTTGAALEAALNVVHRADFKPEDFSDDVLKGVADTAGRRDRDRLQLLRRYAASQQGGHFSAHKGSETAAADRPQSLDDAVHATGELSRLMAMVPAPDWELLIGVAVGASYEELAGELATSSAALRSRVCRLRETIA